MSGERSAPQRRLELFAELVQFFGIEVADRPEVEIVFAPLPHIIAVQTFHRRAAMDGVLRRRAEQIDGVDAAAIDDDGGRAALNNIVMTG